MKKTILFLVAVTMVLAAHATILRVSNVSGSSAPYAFIQDALINAADGDTIIVDGSNISYGSLVQRDSTQINKKVYIFGPGYWLAENGRTDIGAASAVIDDLDICAEGVEIHGMYINGGVNVSANKVVINRCYIFGGISIDIKLQDIIIHQNVLCNRINGKLFNNSNGIFPPVVTINNVQITNNIFMNYPSGSGRDGGIGGFTNSIIANNTWTMDFNCGLSQIYDSTVKDNIMREGMQDNRCDGTSFINNVDIEWGEKIKTDLDVQKVESSVGAFSGSDPYVISGVPAGPIITDIDMPVSVEMGSKLNVTIKVDISR